MSNNRAQTLEALSTFIQTQKDLLARVQDDNDKLRAFKQRAIADPNEFVREVLDNFDGGTPLVGSIPSEVIPPQNVDWSLYDAKDASAMREFAMTLREAYSTRNEPPVHTHYEATGLHRLVRDARKTMVDPVLASLPPISDEEDAIEAAEASNRRLQRARERVKRDRARVHRERERQKKEHDHAELRELHRHLAEGYCKPYGTRGAVLRTEAGQDESMDVDVTVDDVPPPAKTPRLPKVVLKLSDPTSSPTQPSLDLPVSVSPSSTSAVTIVTSVPRGQQRSETFKQAWSMSEQHLLERLMEEIPDGERNRWAKISAAMHGRRTPRQVASRVQKYFLKLKKYGLESNS